MPLAERPARERPRHPRLDRATIVQAVLDLGVDRFSMHAVARRLGVTAAALYRHVAGRDELVTAALDSLCERIALPASTGDWQRDLVSLAHAIRRALGSLPGAARYVLAVGPASPSALRVIDHGLGLLRHAGFEALDAWRAYGIVSNYVFLFVQVEEQLRRASPTGPVTPQAFVSLGPEHADRFPGLAWCTAALGGALDFDEAFDANVRTIVAGIAAGPRRAGAATGETFP